MSKVVREWWICEADGEKCDADVLSTLKHITKEYQQELIHVVRKSDYDALLERTEAMVKALTEIEHSLENTAYAAKKIRYAWQAFKGEL